jgi:predicted permease
LQVGGGGLSDALQLLTTCVPFWAALAGVALSVTHSALPATLAAVVPPLAGAHLPLALLTAGAAADFTPLQAYQLRDVGLVLGARLLPPLLAGAAAALLAPPAWLPLVCVLVLLLTGAAARLDSGPQPSGVLQEACCSVLAGLHAQGPAAQFMFVFATHRRHHITGPFLQGLWRTSAASTRTSSVWMSVWRGA